MLGNNRPRRWLERALIGGAVVAAAWVGVGSLRAAMFERKARGVIERPVPDAHVAATAPAAPLVVDEVLPRGTSLGVLEIPRLRFSEAIAEGDDNSTLGVAIGHLPDSPMPWRVGNSVFAGHRDTNFRALRAIQIGDIIRLRTSRGSFDYRVVDKLIVTPDDVSVLAPTRGRELTLVTCYPFSYIGPAPQRFIVKAEEVVVPS